MVRRLAALSPPVRRPRNATPITLRLRSRATAITQACRPECMKLKIPPTAHNIFSTYVRRVREHLHVVMCMSPMGDAAMRWRIPDRNAASRSGDCAIRTAISTYSFVSFAINSSRPIACNAEAPILPATVLPFNVTTGTPIQRESAVATTKFTYNHSL